MGYHKPPQVVDRAAGVNRKRVQNALVPLTLKQIDTRDTQAVKDRIVEYLNFCMDKDIAPSVAGCCSWIGISTRTLEFWRNGQRATPEHQKIAIAYYTLLESIWAEDMHNGNINPVSGIFIGKVFFGYKESQEIVISRNEEPTLSTEELIAEAKRLAGE